MYNLIIYYTPFFTKSSKNSQLYMEKSNKKIKVNRLTKILQTVDVRC